MAVLLSFAILLDSIIYFQGKYTRIQGSVDTYVILWNNHMHAPPYVSGVKNGSLISTLFINL